MMGYMGKASPASTEATKRYFKALERAREIDPEAFKGMKVTRYTSEQEARQWQAMEKARAELNKPA